MDNSTIEFRKKVAGIKRLSKISECFYHDKSKCKGDIKQSHSLQRNGRLSIIEGNVNGQNQVYSFANFESDDKKFIKKLKPIGKGEASTFFGFCDYHDTLLFSPIEGTNKFDESDFHCFLHTYRSFAHSYHRKKENVKLNSDKNYTKDFPDYITKDMLDGAKLGLRDLEKYKSILDKMIENKTYSELEYFIYVFPDLYPIACSTIISPHFTYKGKIVNYSDSSSVTYSPLMLTILPDTDKTIVIFGWFPNDDNSNQFINELEDLTDYHFQIALSSILINYAENTFFAPALYDSLNSKGQKLLLSELENAIATMPVKFPICRTNFFAPSLSAKRLKINCP